MCYMNNKRQYIQYFPTFIVPNAKLKEISTHGRSILVSRSNKVILDINILVLIKKLRFYKTLSFTLVIKKE